MGFALALPLISGLPGQAQAEPGWTDVEVAQTEEIQADVEAEDVESDAVDAQLTEEQTEVEPIEVTPAPAATPVAVSYTHLTLPTT